MAARTASAKSSAKKVRAHRAKLRAQGLRPIQIWVPDVNDPKFIEEARRQSYLIAQSPQEKDDQAFLDSLWDELWDQGFYDK
ncbi:MAG: antitoxin MazE family protein [Proteobacteria bacterium]|nr:antitoxin MazE family protein [Pseudomonadota bacterium]